MRRPVLLGLAVLVSVAACGDDSEVKRDAAGGEGGSIIDGGAGTGGGGSGGGMGGGGGSAGDAGVACPVSSFVTPTAGQVLTPSGNGTGTGADAAVGDGGAGDGGAVVSACPGGNLTYDVKLATSAANGQMVALFAGSAQIATATANGAVVEFKNVQLAQGAQMLRAQVVGVPATCAAAMVNVTVDCMLPTCSITKPVISASHPKLNNVAAPNGDRVSSPGSDYQVAFEVTTNIEDGQPVRLEVAAAGNSSAVTTINGVANGGKATFAGVTLRPDGDFQVQAACTNKLGLTSRSAKGTYPVDTDAPQLTVVSPTDGKHYNPGDLMAGKFGVCVTTTSTDAVNVPVSVTSMGMNLSAAIGTASPERVAVTSGSNGMDCVPLTCPGGAPFDVNVALSDVAGNVTTKKIAGVTCASTLPSVQIVFPAGDSEFTDKSKRLLAATSGQDFRDLNAARNGAQTNVVACTDRADAKARLYAGIQGGAATQVGDEVTVAAATAGDNCPNGFGFVARWTGVTLPESSANADGTLVASTELRVDVTDISTAIGSSPATRIWVDTVAPTLSPAAPLPFCGRIEQIGTDYVAAVTLVSTAPGTVLTVTNGSSIVEYRPQTIVGTSLNFGNVTFPLGDNTVTAVATEPSGNSTALAGPCVLRVGLVPVVNFELPAPGANLCASGSTGCAADADPGTAGWQGTLRALVTIGGSPVATGTVTFSVGDTSLGEVNIDGTGRAELTNVSIPDGAGVVLKAVTSDITGTGTGALTRMVVVDTTPPDSVATVNAVVKLRRQTTFNLAWTAPADGSNSVSSYLVRYSTSPIDAGNFAAATNVTYGGTAAAAGQPDGVDVANLLIEREYYFAVAPVDAAGNVGGITAAGPVAARFNVTTLTPPAGGPANERFGSTIDGSTDIDGDGRSDLLVGTLSKQQAYIFRGATDFATVNAPSVTFSGPAGAAFGRAFVNVGDIDADGREDLAISAPRTGNGKIFIYKGRQVWNSAYTDSQADYTIELDATYAGSEFGASMARAGDFNADGVADFIVGAPAYNSSRGRVVIILGKAGFDPAALSTIVIDGDPATLGATFGSRVVGLGSVYTDTPGSTVAVSAPLTPTTLRGRVFLFQGLTAASNNVSAARAFAEGPDGSLYGAGSISPLGAIGASPRAFGIGAPGTNSTGFAGLADLWLPAPNQPFAGAPKRLINSAATVGSDAFGRITFGGAFSGTNATVNFIGDTTPDLVIASQGEGGMVGPMYVLDGSTIPALGASSDVRAVATLKLPLPSDWKGIPPSTFNNGALRDVNGDEAGDIAIAEYAASNLAGRVLVFW